MTRVLLSVLAVTFSACLLGGCGIHGNKIDTNVALQIQKGETRSKVEGKLGKPDFDNWPDKNGVCHVVYKYDENHGDIPSMIPYVNLFAGGQKIRSQLLQITYRHNIVEECEFSDNTMKISGGLVNMHVRQAPTPDVYPAITPEVQPK